MMSDSPLSASSSTFVSLPASDTPLYKNLQWSSRYAMVIWRYRKQYVSLSLSPSLSPSPPISLIINIYFDLWLALIFFIFRSQKVFHFLSSLPRIDLSRIHSYQLSPHIFAITSLYIHLSLSFYVTTHRRRHFHTM